MAISNLRCTRDGTTLTVIWSWDLDQGGAKITVTRLLDGAELACKTVGQALYRSAISGPRHGPVLEVPAVPVRVQVEDGENSQSLELLDVRYTVEWRLARRNVYSPKRMFRPPELLHTDTFLQLRFPCEGEVPEDLFYYALTGPGGKRSDRDPVGYLPSLRPGNNEYGVILPPGRSLVLCCNTRREEISRLFDFRRLPDFEF